MLHATDKILIQNKEDYPAPKTSTDWGNGVVEPVKVECRGDIAGLKKRGYVIICVPGVFWLNSEEEFRNETSLNGAGDAPNTTDIVMRQLMSMSEENHFPKLKRGSLKGAATLNRFMGRVIPQTTGSHDGGNKVVNVTSHGTIAAAFCPDKTVDNGIREFILDSGASVHLGQSDLLTSPESRLTDLDNPMTLESANGQMQVTQYVDSHLPALDCNVKLRVAEHTPGALSLGELCRYHGLSFHWEAWQKRPRVYNAQGTEIKIHMRSNCPYISNISVDGMACPGVAPEEVVDPVVNHEPLNVGQEHELLRGMQAEDSEPDDDDAPDANGGKNAKLVKGEE